MDTSKLDLIEHEVRERVANSPLQFFHGAIGYNGKKVDLTEESSNDNQTNDSR